jgi:hypothetical protein
MAESLILKSQANELFQLIESVHLLPQDFKWTTVNSVNEAYLEVSKLIHISSNYYFQFDFRGGNRFYEFSPGDTAQFEKASAHWDIQKKAFIRWLNNLKREIESPDLWSAIANEKIFSEAPSSDNNDAIFSNEERIRIAQNINEIKQYLLSTQSFSTEQKQYLDGRFDYLVAASERLGRKDWILLAVGTLTNIIIGMALMPDIARELFRIAGAVLKWVLITQLLK